MLNIATGQFLNSARVSSPGTGLSAFTDETGTYRLARVPAGLAAVSGGVVKLDAFTVSSERETNSEAIAINEQRFAPNLKNVVAADALGDVMDSNVGEFLKFMPGVTAEYDLEAGGAVASVSVRGFEYITRRTTLDLSLDFQLSRRLSLYGNAQNVFNVPETLQRYGPETPHYAKHHRETKHGVQITVGVKGVF